MYCSSDLKSNFTCYEKFPIFLCFGNKSTLTFLMAHEERIVPLVIKIRSLSESVHFLYLIWDINKSFITWGFFNLITKFLKNFQYFSWFCPIQFKWYFLWLFVSHFHPESSVRFKFSIIIQFFSFTYGWWYQSTHAFITFFLFISWGLFIIIFWRSQTKLKLIIFIFMLAFDSRNVN